MRKTTEATEGAARGGNHGMATLIIELLRTKHLLFYINQSRTALNGSLEISPYWRFPVLGAKHKKDPFLIACICILLLNQKRGGCYSFNCRVCLMSSPPPKCCLDLSSRSQSSWVSGCCLVLPLVHIYRSDDGRSCLGKASAQVGWAQCC